MVLDGAFEFEDYGVYLPFVKGDRCFIYTTSDRVDEEDEHFLEINIVYANNVHGCISKYLPNQEGLDYTYM